MFTAYASKGHSKTSETFLIPIKKCVVIGMAGLYPSGVRQDRIMAKIASESRVDDRDFYWRVHWITHRRISSQYAKKAKRFGEYDKRLLLQCSYDACQKETSIVLSFFGKANSVEIIKDICGDAGAISLEAGAFPEKVCAVFLYHSNSSIVGDHTKIKTMTAIYL